MTLPRTSRGRNRSRLLAMCCTALVAGSWAGEAPAKDAAGLAITAAAPEGFSDLEEARTLLVDVYFGGKRVGEAKIGVAPGEVTFLEPSATLDLLPGVADRQAVEDALSGTLEANASLACGKTSDPSQCGRLSPDVAGVIFDRDNFRIDIFLNPRFLAVNEAVADAYLPEPDGGIAIINTVGAVLSGQSGRGSDYYNFQDSVIVGDGERRLRADLSYASEIGFGAERLAFEWDRPGLRYSAGALWAPGNDILGRRKILGAGIETQIDTRLDRDVMLGSPIVVYLDQRARVDIVRDGRVLSSAIYESGNQQLDTSTLPDGSYDIVLRIEEPGRAAREERRFYTKSRRVPSQGRTDFYAFGGVLIDEGGRQSLDVSGHPYFQGGIAHRLDDSWVLEGGIEATDETASAEIAAMYLSDVVQLRAAAVANDSGTYGGVLQVRSAGNGRFNFNFDLRRFEAEDFNGGLPTPPIPPAGPGGSLLWYGGSYSQVNGVVAYSVANLRFLGTVFYRDDETQDAQYSLGPSLEWDVLRKGPLTVTLRGDLTATERGESGFAGVAVRFFGARSTFAALGGGRATNRAGDELGEGPVAAASASWSPTLAGGDLSLGVGIDHQPRQDNLVASTEFRHALGTLSGDFVRSDNASAEAVSQYSLGMQTTFAVGGGAFEIAGETTTESMIVARVKSARESDRFDVFVNEQVAGTIVGAGPFTLALPAYRAYDIRIRPTGEGLLAYDNGSRSVSLYPGTVTDLNWVVAPVTIKYGRLIGPGGEPVARASLTGKGIWGETDDDGNFQIEAPDDAELEVTLRDGRTFSMHLPAGEAKAGIARLGNVVCCAEPGVTLSALGEQSRLPEGGSQ